MTASKGHDEISLSPVSDVGTSKAGGASPKLLEQLNAQKLDRLLEAVGDKGESPVSPTPNQGDSMNPGLQSFLKWAGLSLPLIVAIVAATIWVSNTIDNKVRESRLELKSDIESSKTQLSANIDAAKLELKTESIRVQDDLKRMDEKMDRNLKLLDDKIDRKMDKLSEQLSTIQQEIKNQKK